jgi:hypothetical protein
MGQVVQDYSMMLRQLVLSLLLVLPTIGLPARSPLAILAPNPEISKAAADSCDAKVQLLEAYAGPGTRQTSLSEEELNSYFALVASPHYHPSLKSVLLTFKDGRVVAVASIDFDRLNFSSTQFLNGLMRSLLTGVHTLMVSGDAVSGKGKANFNLEESRFDAVALPNLLVSEIISTVGLKQKPPFDPMQPSALPYHIQKIDVRSGYIVLYQ